MPSLRPTYRRSTGLIVVLAGALLFGITIGPVACSATHGAGASAIGDCHALEPHAHEHAPAEHDNACNCDDLCLNRLTGVAEHRIPVAGHRVLRSRIIAPRRQAPPAQQRDRAVYLSRAPPSALSPEVLTFT